MNKDLTFNTRMVNFVDLNNKTIELKRQVDEYIGHKIKIGLIHKISQSECVRFIKEGPDSLRFYNITPKYNVKKTINDYFDDFYNFKKEELNNRPSYKDYLTLSNSIKDYQKYHKTQLTFDIMNDKEFMVKYRNFLSEKRGKEYISRGGLNDNTINKRMTCLKTFFKWCEEKELFTFKSIVHNFPSPKYHNNIVVVTKEEILNLLELKFENKTWEKIRDVFVCNCFLGLRISDLKTLGKKDFVLDKDGDYILIKENKKTNIRVEIPVVGTCLKILTQYDFELPKFSDQYFNSQLKLLLEDKDLFGEPVTKKRRVNRDVQDKSVPRRKLISSHTCRRTFITLGISENVPINSLMLSSGHKQIQTLQKYMKKVLDKKSFKKIDISIDNKQTNEDNTSENLDVSISMN
jgi:integrase